MKAIYRAAHLKDKGVIPDVDSKAVARYLRSIGWKIIDINKIDFKQIDKTVGNEVPPRIPRPQSDNETVFVRCQEVIELAKALAKGSCERCGEEGFETASGDAYLEVHHVHHLAEGGPDLITNVVAICANCHRKMHSAADKNSLKKALYDLIERLKPTEEDFR